MEIQLKKRLQSSLLGIAGNFIDLRRRITGAVSNRVDDLDSSAATYETSKTHLIHMAEVEIRRSEAIIEAQRRIVR